MFNFRSPLSKLLVSIAIVALVLIQVGTPSVAAQSNVTYITSNDQLPEKGQLVIPANVGWRAPASVHGLVVTLWYGGKDDNVSTMLHLSDGLAADRSLKYGDSKESYKTVVWDGDRAPISDGQNCRPDFYSDSVVLTEGVVYGDRCPIVIEYHIEHFVPAIANATATAMAPAATATHVAPAATATEPPAIVGTPTVLPAEPTIIPTTPAACEPPAKPDAPSGYVAQFNPGLCDWDLVRGEPSEMANDDLYDQMQWRMNTMFFIVVSLFVVIIVLLLWNAFYRRPAAPKKVEKEDQ